MPEAAKPNILVIWGDDIGITNLSCYSDGLMGYRTPNIDRIADEGMRFTEGGGARTPRSRAADVHVEAHESERRLALALARLVSSVHLDLLRDAGRVQTPASDMSAARTDHFTDHATSAPGSERRLPAQ
jgi:hypothetical protein